MMTFRCPSRLLLVALCLIAVTAQARPTPEAVLAAKQAKETAHEAAVVAKQAKAYYQQKQFALAAELYRRAYQLNPLRPEFLYGVGRSEQMAGHRKEAREALESLRRLLPSAHPLQAKAAASLVEMQDVVEEPTVVIPPPIVVPPPAPATPTVAIEPIAAPLPIAPTPELAQLPPVVVQTPPEGPSHAFTQAAMWTGAGLTLAGIGLAIAAEVERGSLVAAKGTIRGTEASSRQDTINTLSTVSVVAVAMGAGSLALGLYWRFGERSAGERQPTLSLTPTSLRLAWRF